MRMETKAQREEYRQYLINLNKCDSITHHQEEDCLVCLFPSGERYGLLIFDGTAGKPTTYCDYRSTASRDQEIARHLKNRKARAEYRQQRKAEHGSTLSGAAVTAKAIRARLKQAFPTVKFSVTSDTFSMGDSVDISYIDGPIHTLVSFITDDYQAGHFDGMEDCYNYRAIPPDLGCPGAKYVHVSREQSDALRAELLAHCQQQHGTVPGQYQDGMHFNAWAYENSNPETWAPEYQELHRIQQEELCRRMHEQEAEHLAEIKPLSHDDSNGISSMDPLESSNIVSLDAFRQQKEEQAAQSAADETEMLLASLTNEQLAAAMQSLRLSQDPSRDMIARFFLQELSNRDRALAVSVFKSSWLYKGAK